MTENYDGLAALENKREQRKTARRMPPPRNPAPPKPSQPTETVAAPPADAIEESSADESSADQPARITRPRKPSTAVKQGDPSPTGRTVAPSTIYFDATANDWLTEASIAGMRGGPRIDSRSAFVRLAMRLLMEQMTPQQAVDLLRAEAAEKPSNTPGRPRL